MNFKDKLKFVYNSIEEELPVDTWKYADINIWPLLRMKINNEIHYSELINDNTVSAQLITRLNENFFKRLSDYMNNNYVDIEHNAEIVKEKSGAVFCTHSIARRIVVEGRYYDVYCDPFIEQLENIGIPSLVLERGFGENVKIPRYNKSKYIEREIMLYMFRNSYKFANHLLQGWHLPKTEKKELIHKLQAVGIDANKILKEIPYNIIFIKLVSSYYKQYILQEVKPIIAFVLSYYGILSMPFVLACRQLKIPVVNIQMGTGDVNYVDFLRIPIQGYELLPNYFWSSIEEKIVFKYIDGCNRDIHQTIYGGDLWIKKWKHNPLPEWIEYDQKFAVKGDGKFNILYTLQIGLSTPKHLVDVINSSPSDWLWWIRLHPRMKKDDSVLQEFIASIQKDNVIFEEAISFPLLSLLKNADVHITRFSSSVWEAEQMNVPSIIIDEQFAYRFEEQILRGAVFVGVSYEEIFGILSKLKKDRRKIRLINQNHVSVVELLELIK